MRKLEVFSELTTDMSVGSNMFSLILYSLVIVNQIECIENRGETTTFSSVTTNQLTSRKKHKPKTTDLEATKYSLTDPVVINVDPNESHGIEEYNYIINIPKPSFLR